MLIKKLTITITKMILITRISLVSSEKFIDLVYNYSFHYFAENGSQ